MQDTLNKSLDGTHITHIELYYHTLKIGLYMYML